MIVNIWFRKQLSGMPIGENHMTYYQVKDVIHHGHMLIELVLQKKNVVFPCDVFDCIEIIRDEEDT